MTDREVLDSLLRWEEGESVDRDVWRMRRGEMTREALFARWPADNCFLKLALDPRKFPDVVAEEYLLKGDRNVAVSKHPRYNPMSLHAHDYFEMNYVVQGSCTQRFEDGAARLSEGDFCMLSPDARHAIEAFDDAAIVLNLAIRRGTFLKQFSALSMKDSPISQFFMDNLYSRKKLRYLLVRGAGDAAVRHVILQMVAEEARRDRYSDDILTASTTILFNLLLRAHADSMEAPPLRQTQSALTDALLGYIHRHYAEVTLQQVADEFHFSRQYCSRLIADMTGCSFSELVTGFRIGHGEDLLRNTFLSVEEIGARVGYANPETFIRAFRRVRGVTPRQFRQAGE